MMRLVVPVVGWLVLTGADPDGLALGALVVAVSFLAGSMLGARGSGVSPLAILQRLPFFLWRSLLGGIDVAWRALHPRMPLQPGWITVGTRLPRGALRAVVGGEFSLMPGTLVAGSRGDELLVHLLDTRSPVAEEVKEEEGRLLKAADRKAGRTT